MRLTSNISNSYFGHEISINKSEVKIVERCTQEISNKMYLFKWHVTLFTIFNTIMSSNIVPETVSGIDLWYRLITFKPLHNFILTKIHYSDIKVYLRNVICSYEIVLTIYLPIYNERDNA